MTAKISKIRGFDVKIESVAIPHCYRDIRRLLLQLYEREEKLIWSPNFSDPISCKNAPTVAIRLLVLLRHIFFFCHILPSPKYFLLGVATVNDLISLWEWFGYHLKWPGVNSTSGVHYFSVLGGGAGGYNNLFLHP